MSSNSTTSSLHDLVCNHLRHLRNPLQWTSRHLRLIGCRFGDINTAPVHPQRSREDNKRGGEFCSQESKDAQAIATNLSADKKRQCLVKILAGGARVFTTPRKGPSFHFQSRSIHRPDYLVFHRREPLFSRSSTPLVGYVHYTKIGRDRTRYFKQARVTNTAPTEWSEDPYFLCHLLALAQLQEQMSLSASPKVFTFTSRLLITNVLDSEYIYLYEAQVSRELLDGLRDLKIAIYPITWPTIRRKRIPFQPYSTFPSRLRAELVAYCEPYSPRQKRPREQEKQGALKRRRINSIPSLVEKVGDCQSMK